MIGTFQEWLFLSLLIAMLGLLIGLFLTLGRWLGVALWVRTLRTRQSFGAYKPDSTKQTTTAINNER